MTPPTVRDVSNRMDAAMISVWESHLKRRGGFKDALGRMMRARVEHFTTLLESLSAAIGTTVPTANDAVRMDAPRGDGSITTVAERVMELYDSKDPQITFLLAMQLTLRPFHKIFGLEEHPNALTTLFDELLTRHMPPRTALDLAGADTSRKDAT